MREVRWKVVSMVLRRVVRYRVSGRALTKLPFVRHPAAALARSPICDSYVRPAELVRICDECNFGTYGGRCIICGSPGKPHCRSPSERASGLISGE